MLRKLWLEFEILLAKRVLLNRAPTATQLHPALPSSIQLISVHFSLLHYKNQDIAYNWAFFQNLGQKIKSCPF